MIRLGTRSSALARWQAEWVGEQLRRRGHEVELIPIQTRGDRKSAPIAELGGTGVFTKELQNALLEGSIDVAVHSLKDLPTTTVEGLILAAVPTREIVWDAWISSDGTAWNDIAQGARIGTGSLRRQAQLLHQRPDLQVLDIRGNVDTRLRKLADREYDAIVLAVAGLQRLGWTNRMTQVLPADVMLPAVGQGALGIETRADDNSTHQAVAALTDADTHAAVLAERAMLATLRGGCLAPVAAWGRVEDDQLKLDGVVLSADGSQRLDARSVGKRADATQLGQAVGEELLAAGADELLRTRSQE